MRFMIKSTRKPGLTEQEFAEMLDALPAQQVKTEALIKQGIVEGATFVAADRSAGWSVMNCESQDKALEILQGSPLYKFIDSEITPLLTEEDNYQR